jgi:hypothetical protein
MIPGKGVLIKNVRIAFVKEFIGIPRQVAGSGT